MSHTPAWRRYLRFWRPDVAADVDDELRFHLEERVEDLVARGLSPGDARAQAAEEFGDVERVRGDLRTIGERRQRRSGRIERLAVLAHDVRLAVRRLARQPGFSIPVVLTLALGLGATLAVFTVLDRVVLRPLPYASADRLVRLTTPVPGVAPDAEWGLATGQYHFFRQETRTLESMALYRAGGQATVGDAAGALPAERTGVATVSASMHEVLGIAPVLGRPMRVEDNLAGPPASVWLAHGLWDRMFGGDPGIIGQTILVHGLPLTVAGVLAADARLPEELERPESVVGLWLPLHLDPADPGSSHTLRAIGRLRSGVPLGAAQAEFAELTSRLPEALPRFYPPSFIERFGFGSRVTTLRDSVLGGVERVLWVLFGAVALVLLVAGANVANLFLARTEARRQETAVRSALGAGTGQLARHFLLESLALTALAAALAFALAAVALALLRSAAPAGLPRLEEVAVGWTGGGLLALLTITAAVVLGLLPLLRRGGSGAVAAEVGRGITASRGQQAARATLVVAQVAISVVLLAGGALLHRSFRELRAVQPGFVAEDVHSFRVLLPGASYDGDEQVAALYETLAERFAALPGVVSVGASSVLPLTPGIGCSGVMVSDGIGEDGACIPFVHVTPGYFETLGIPVRGDAFTWGDVRRQERVAMLSEAAARRFWSSERALDRTVYASTMEEPRRVIGIAGDVRMDGLDRPPVEAVYLSLLPVARSALGGAPTSLAFVLRAPGQSAERLMPAIRGVVRDVDPGIAVADAAPLTAVVERSMARVTFTAWLLAAASGVAVILSAIGIYGVIGYVVARRRSEIGIRLALGARTGEVARLVVLQSVRYAIAGVLLGLVGALLATRVLRSLLHGVSPTDPVVLGTVAGVLVLLAALASWIPARRAMRVPPVEALRG